MVGFDAIGVQPVLFTHAAGETLSHLLIGLTLFLEFLVIFSHIVTRVIRKLL